jgi:predicted MFS family arabinose efflux permease
MARLFPVLSEPAARLYLVGQIVSVHGAWVQDITLNLLTWQLTGSPAMLGAVNFLLFGPAVLAAPLLGPRLDAENVRAITLKILYGALILAVVLALLTRAQWMSVPMIACFALLRGLLTGLEMPARQVLLAASVKDSANIANAVAANTVVFNVARMLGPAIAVALFATTGPAWCFALGAATLLFMIGCVRTMPRIAPRIDSHRRTAARPSLRTAVTYLRSDRIGSLLMPASTLLGVCAGGYQTLIPALADRVFGSAAWTGWLFGAVGAGSLTAGLLLSSRWMPPASRRGQIAMPWAVAIALIGVGLAQDIQVALACLYLMGFGLTFTAAGFNAGLQQRAPAELRGALIGLYSMCFMGAMPLGHLLSGSLAQWLSLRETFLSMAALLALGVTGIFAPRWIALGRFEFDSDRI